MIKCPLHCLIAGIIQNPPAKTCSYFNDVLHPRGYTMTVFTTDYTAKGEVLEWFVRLQPASYYGKPILLGTGLEVGSKLR